MAETVLLLLLLLAAPGPVVAAGSERYTAVEMRFIVDRAAAIPRMYVIRVCSSKQPHLLKRREGKPNPFAERNCCDSDGRASSQQRAKENQK